MIAINKNPLSGSETKCSQNTVDGKIKVVIRKVQRRVEKNDMNF